MSIIIKVSWTNYYSNILKTESFEDFLVLGPNLHNACYFLMHFSTINNGRVFKSILTIKRLFIYKICHRPISCFGLFVLCINKGRAMVASSTRQLAEARFWLKLNWRSDGARHQHPALRIIQPRKVDNASDRYSTAVTTTGPEKWSSWQMRLRNCRVAQFTSVKFSKEEMHQNKTW